MSWDEMYWYFNEECNMRMFEVRDMFENGTLINIDELIDYMVVGSECGEIGYYLFTLANPNISTKAQASALFVVDSVDEFAVYKLGAYYIIKAFISC